MHAETRLLAHCAGWALPALALIMAASAASAGVGAARPAANGRERILFDAGWRFHLGDVDRRTSGEAIRGWQWKADERGEASAKQMAAATLDAADAGGWQEAPPGEDTFHGRRGFNWYRTTLPDMKPNGPHHTLHFESVDDNATVYLNGQRLLHHEVWDDPFDVPLDSAWRAGGPNVVAVLVENTAGAGGIGETILQSGQPADPDAATGPALPDFDDRSWRALHLPHDFVVEGTFDPKANGSHGFLPAGVGWYRKTFDLPAADRGRRLWLDFDGVYRDSGVWLNGHFLGRHPSGYTSFRYDISNVANYGGTNTLVVRADARRFEGWWYEGGGIYRHVWLNKADPLHVAPWGVYVTAAVPNGDSVEAPGSAEITVRTQVVNQTGAPAPCRLVSEIHAPDGRVVATIATEKTLAAETHEDLTQRVVIRSPRLWSLETPALYHVVTRVERGGQPVDSVSTAFGIRTIRFDAAKGFFLNGKSVKLKGTCNHQDFAGVGTAMPDSLLEWRIKRLKEMGGNAYRCSHNPPAAELLDACDRLGMLVMDENRHLGDTYRDHTPPGTPYSDLRDLKSMILRDRNHPSIIMWSMCNEEGLQSTEEGARIFAAMKKVTNDLDPTRPVTCAMNGGWGQGISNIEDLQGCNYNPRGYDAFHAAHPDMPAYGSETASTVSTRGIYANDPERGYVSAYDVNAPPWAQTAEVAWSSIAERPWMAGSFAWTGFDYRGEPTPYGWPCINSHFGIMDMCGFPKDNYYYYQAWWIDKPSVHILPHWNWQGKEGQPIDVWAYSNCDRVELLLDGKSLGVKEMPRYGHVQWSVPYAPGRLEARAFKGDSGSPVAATDVVETTGAPAAIRLTPDRKTMRADGEDVIMVAVAVLDAKGRVVPTAGNEVQFEVTGAGHVAGVGNGDPSSHEPDKASRRHAFNGLCMVVVQAGEQPGRVTLTATSPGLKPGRLTLDAKR